MDEERDPAVPGPSEPTRPDIPLPPPSGAPWAPASPSGAPWAPAWPAPGSVTTSPTTSAPRRPPSWLAVVVVAALVGGAVGAAVAATVGGTSTSSGSAISVGKASPGPALAGGASIPAIVQRVLPEVVSIDALGPAGEDQGTGMILASDGEVLTNNHVIAGATKVTVTLYGQTTALSASLVGADPSNDAALLKLDTPPANLQAVTFGNSKQLEVGDAVIAVGNALGLSAGTPTVTSGIVSALGRTVQAGDTGGGATENLTNMIQTDAAINSGNSGGPLVDSSGDVVAMDTAVAASSGGNAPAENIGFAIPSATIEGLLASLRRGGTAKAPKAYLGVEVEDETAQLQQAYGFAPSAGAVVVQVVAGSPAAAAGVAQGDVIVAFNAKPVTSAQDLTNDVQGSAPGRKVQVTVYRGQQKLTLSATLAQAPAG
ncbi:MAG TPA: trypsin-like peptidase domain-containing protein [Acidimicrobiales bacterium]|nr:trypsin-like peptidase domain-containing protein [Acidimicrobiales bacterium]